MLISTIQVTSSLLRFMHQWFHKNGNYLLCCFFEVWWTNCLPSITVKVSGIWNPKDCSAILFMESLQTPTARFKGEEVKMSALKIWLQTVGLVEDKRVLGNAPYMKLKPYSTVDSRNPPHDWRKKPSHHLLPHGEKASTIVHVVDWRYL